MTVNISKRESELVVSFDYSQERITKVKSINGHKWNPNDKIWTIPFTESNLLMLKELFRNEQKNIDIEDNLRNREIYKRMEEDIKLKGYSFKTKKSYMSHIKRFSSFINKNLDEIVNDDVRQYTLFLLENRNVSHSYVNQAISSIRFLCNEVLRQNKIIELMCRPKKVNYPMF